MGIAAVIVGGIALVSLTPIILTFVTGNAKHKRENDLEQMRCQKEILELEIRKNESQLRLLEAENKRLDRVIYEKK